MGLGLIVNARDEKCIELCSILPISIEQEKIRPDQKQVLRGKDR
jgi:hypothetical protein